MNGILSSQGGPSSWSVLAVAGVTHVRFVDVTVAGCLAWAANMRDQGWTVGEPERWPGYGEPWDGFGGYTIQGEAA